MEAKKRNKLTTVAMILVAIIFLTSYGAYANNNTGQTTSTTTAVNQQTYLVTGVVNAIVRNYSVNLNIVLLNTSQNSSVGDKISNILGNLQSNGSVLNYIYNLGAYQVYLGDSINAYELQSLLNESVGSKYFRINTTTLVVLPNPVSFDYHGVTIAIPTNGQRYGVVIEPLLPVNSSVKVGVQALVTANGILYQNQIRVNYTR